MINVKEIHNTKTIVRTIQNLGWFEVKTRTGHRKFKHLRVAEIISVPNHSNRGDISKFLSKQILEIAVKGE